MRTQTYVHDISLSADVAALRRGELSLSTLINSIQARFEATNPTIQAFLPEPNRFERLRQDAEQLAARYPDPTDRPPLYGAVLGVKDIFHVSGFITRAGSSLPAALFAGAEAAIVTGLKNAGALILGKTVTTEFAYFEPGPTRNPHNPAHTPGGSSSGSAAALAAGIAHVATGTQTVGSVIRPAAYCGVVGYKPSYGRVPTAGLVTFSPSADHVGFFSGDVADMALVSATVIDGWQPVDAAGEQPVVAVPEGAYLQQSTAVDVFEAQLYVLEGAGYAIKRVRMFDDIDMIDGCHQDLIAAELAQQHREWFPRHAELYRPRTAALIQYGRTISPVRLQAARQHQLIFRQRLHDAMDAHGIDLWLCPAAPDVAPYGIDATGSPKMNMPWTHAGTPALSLPAGRGTSGLPLGLQLIGRFGQDERLLAWAAEIEPLFRA